MRILQLTPKMPYPPLDGGRGVMLQTARALRGAGADVRVLSLNPRKHHSDVEAARRALAPIPIDAVDIDTSLNFDAVLTALRSGLPLVAARFVTSAFRNHLREVLRGGDFDVVQLESPFMLPYLAVIRQTSRAVVVLRSHNVEFRVWEQLAQREKNPGRRMMLHAVARSIRRFEIRNLNTCDAIVPIAEKDAEQFRALGCTLPLHVLPAGVESSAEPNLATPSGPPRVAFLGSLDYRPNQEAALWIVEELRPRLSPEVEIHIGGSHAPPWLGTRLQVAGITFHGEVADARAFIGPMHVVAAPILSGSGMSIKILEAMAWGKAIVATTAAAASLDVRNGENILLADDAGSFASAVSLLIREPARALAIGAAAQAFVQERYDPDALARRLTAFYASLVAGRAAGL